MLITIGPSVVWGWIDVVVVSMIASLIVVIITSVIALVTAVTAGLFSAPLVASWTAGAMVVFSISLVRTSSSIGLISISVGNSNLIFPTGTTFPPIFLSRILYPYFLAALTDSSEMKNLSEFSPSIFWAASSSITLSSV